MAPASSTPAGSDFSGAENDGPSISAAGVRTAVRHRTRRRSTARPSTPERDAEYAMCAGAAAARPSWESSSEEEDNTALDDVGDLYDECMPADVNNGIDGGSISLRSPGGSIHTVDYEHPTEE